MPANDQRYVRAARWWADQLREPPAHNNGDVLQSGLARLVAAQMPRPSPEQIEQFRAALLGLLQDERPNLLMTDYGPDVILAQAGRAAGIAHLDLGLPIKTTMDLTEERILVSVGYGAPYLPLELEGQDEGGGCQDDACEECPEEE